VKKFQHGEEKSFYLLFNLLRTLQADTLVCQQKWNSGRMAIRLLGEEFRIIISLTGIALLNNHYRETMN